MQIVTSKNIWVTLSGESGIRFTLVATDTGVPQTLAALEIRGVNVLAPGAIIAASDLEQVARVIQQLRNDAGSWDIVCGTHGTQPGESFRCRICDAERLLADK